MDRQLVARCRCKIKTSIFYKEFFSQTSNVYNSNSELIPVKFIRDPSLYNIINSEHRYVSPVAGDGNCLFRSISQAVFRSPIHHVELRHAAVDIMVSHRDEFEPFVDQAQFASHIMHMYNSNGALSTWGTQAEIFALATILQCPIYVLTYNTIRAKWLWYKFHPLMSTNTSAPSEFITILHSGNHYDAILPENCCLALPPTLEGIRYDDVIAIDDDPGVTESYNVHACFHDDTGCS